MKSKKRPQLINPQIQKLTNYDINKKSKKLDNHQSICESSKGAQNASTEPQPNATASLPSTEIKPCLDSGSGNPASGKTINKSTAEKTSNNGWYC